MKRIIALLMALAMILVFAGCDSQKPENSKETSGEADLSYEGNGVKTAYADKVAGFQLEAPKAGETVAIMHTSMGDISLRLFPEGAPKTVENFTTHAKEGYYDGLTFHRIINDFMIQGGDPKGTGTGGESIWGTPFEDEFDSKLYNIRGSLAMANSGPNTNGSQFFINQVGPGSFNADNFKGYSLQTYNSIYTNFCESYEQYKKSYPTFNDFMTQYLPTYYSQLAQMGINMPFVYDLVPPEVWDLYKAQGGNIYLDGAFRAGSGHTVFGQVYEGMDIVDKIAAVETDANGKPAEDVIIKTIEIKEFAG